MKSEYDNKIIDLYFRTLPDICKNKNLTPFIIGGFSNHVHIITSLHPSVALSDFVREIRRHAVSGAKVLVARG